MTLQFAFLLGVAAGVVIMGLIWIAFELLVNRESDPEPWSSVEINLFTCLRCGRVIIGDRENVAVDEFGNYFCSAECMHKHDDAVRNWARLNSCMERRSRR